MRGRQTSIAAKRQPQRVRLTGVDGRDRLPERPQNLMKQTVRIAGGINELFGTLDENLKFLESSLHITTHLKDHDLEIEGEPAQVERAARILGAYNDRVQHGHIPSSQEVKSLLHAAAGEPSATFTALSLPRARERSAKKASRRKAPTSGATSRPLKPTTWFSPSAPAAPAKPILRSPWPFPRCSPSK